MKALFLVFALVLTLAGCASPTRAPRSSVAHDSALELARLTAGRFNGTVRTVAATGSMRPVIDEHSVLAIEPAVYAVLQAGDLVLYRRRNGTEVVHRLFEKEGNDWAAMGDANGVIDHELVTPTNYRGRVAAIFYTQP